MRFEASADARKAAVQLRDMYTALISAGFEPDEALRFLAMVIASNSGD